MWVALTRDVSPTLDQCELTHLARQPIDVGVARKQHEEYRQRLSELVARVDNLPGSPQLPDAVFVEDTAVVLDEIAILTRPGVESRRAECAEVEKSLAEYRPLAHITAPGTLEGGDVVRVSRRLFVGLSTRTNKEGIRQLEVLVKPFGYSVSGVRITGCLHLKSVCCALSDGRVLGHRPSFDAEIFSDIEVLAVPEAEPRGANVLSIDSSVILPRVHPRTGALLEAEGLRVISVDNSELLKAEAGVTCSSLVFRAG